MMIKTKKIVDEAETVLDNLKLLYDTYSALGGNGTGTELYTRAKALPIKAEDPLK